MNETALKALTAFAEVAYYLISHMKAERYFGLLFIYIFIYLCLFYLFLFSVILVNRSL